MKEKSEVSVEIKTEGQIFKITFVPWESSHNIYHLLNKDDQYSEKSYYNPKCSRAYFNPYDNVLYCSHYQKTMMINTNTDDYQFTFKLEGEFSHLDLQQQVSLIDFANVVNSGDLSFRLEKTDQFKSHLQVEFARSTPSQISASLKILARSNRWFKNFVDLINFNVISKDLNCRIPWKPTSAKKLLDLFSKEEETHRSQVLSRGGPDSSTNFLGQPQQQLRRLLALLVSIIGDLFEFRESLSYFNKLVEFVFGMDFVTAEHEIFDSPAFEEILQQLLAISPDHLFKLSNCGRKFNEEDPEEEPEEVQFTPLCEDSFVKLHGEDTLDQSFTSDIALLSWNITSN